jgi:L-asparaginase / beta-aspartyl-peptidase
MALIALALASIAVPAVPAAASDVVLVVHGGAGTMPRAELTAEREKQIRADLERALRAGHAVLDAGGASIDAVEKAVRVLEDSPHFNAGKGAVFNHDGVNELDAAIMDGATLRAGSIAGVHRVRNPIALARAVMEKSRHVMLVGDGAEAFAKEAGIELVDPSYFRTERRWQELQDALEEERVGAAPSTAYRGTVGAVARDRDGRIAAATSTGGMTNKRWGRVGDAPIIGAGTYANDRCGVSATGWGEFYIRATVAHDICARVSYRGDTIANAADAVVLGVVPRLGGDGGVIALDRDGNVAMPFNTEGMYRGTIDAGGSVVVAIYKDPPAPREAPQ